MTSDDDWELFVPVVGEEYPAVYQVRDKRTPADWRDGLVPRTNVSAPQNFAFEYRKPKQKDTQVTERTPQQALKDAIDSGAVQAWIDGQEVMWSPVNKDEWRRFGPYEPTWMNKTVKWTVKPPEPTKIAWKPLIPGKEPKGVVLGVWYVTVQSCCFTYGDGWRKTDDGSKVATPEFYAPMCNLPEGDK